MRIQDRNNWLVPALLALLIVFSFNKVLFTDQIIRASDVITQFFWAAKHVHNQGVADYLATLPQIFRADWEPLNDGGRTLEGGWNAIGLLFHRYLIQHFFPFPSCIAWLAVLALAWGGVGTYRYCRLIGAGRLGAFTAGLIFALCTENASLINAGHIQKLEAICWFPWALFFLERGINSGRLQHYALTALMLAIQFFHMHWQISFYSCLAVGLYWCWHVGWRFREEGRGYLGGLGRDAALGAALLVLFFTTVAISFAPLYSWSQQSERGDAVSSSAPAGTATGAEKGIGYEEGMSWSMPPEEVLTFLIPGLAGFSRQEGGDVPAPDQVYYWGRMRFTQTGDYLGLLPWFLIPLPLIFRRDRQTWFFAGFMALTLVMALGKYTPVYRLMFEYLPAFSKFRVPKMILFLFAFGAAVMAGRGMDLLASDSVERDRARGWLGFSAMLVASIGLTWCVLKWGGAWLTDAVAEYITAPTRYQQDGAALASQRYGFMLRETAIACGVASLYLALFLAWFTRWLPVRVVAALLLVLLVADLQRVNGKFLEVTTPPPADTKASKNDISAFLESRIGDYRMQPMNGENAHYYADQGFPNISAYVTISERRYREFLDGFNLGSGMPDMMNLKYLIMAGDEFAAQGGALAPKYRPVFTASNGSVLLENMTVLPKAWLVPSVAEVTDPRQRIAIMGGSPDFDPSRVALVEAPPPLAMPPYGLGKGGGAARVDLYTPNRIRVSATVTTNSLLVLGEKYYRWWYAYVDGKRAEIHPVNHILRGVYLPPGNHTVEFVFDPLPFRIGKYLTIGSLLFMGGMLVRERRREGARLG